MADAKNHNVNSAPDGIGPLRLGPLIGGAMGLLGFGLAVVVGLLAGNDAAAILARATIVTLAMACVGGLAGAVAGRVVAEVIARQRQAIATALASQASNGASTGRGKSDANSPGRQPSEDG